MQQRTILSVCGLLVLVLNGAFAQFYSSQRVRFMVTYNANQNEYTASVVPDYNTPNQNNPEAEERGATAQFTLKVPTSFSLTAVIDVRGQWEKKPYKLMPQAGADPAIAYYVIGKAPQETNYGQFVQGEPLALFRFKGQGGNPDEIGVLAPTDSAISKVDKLLSLNIANSFYSRSGQRSSVSARPLEQLTGVTNVVSVMTELERKLGNVTTPFGKDEAFPVVLYPNPTEREFTVKFFSVTDRVETTIEVMDVKGMSWYKQTLQSKVGLNTILVSLKGAIGANYFVRVSRENKVTVRAIHKL